MSIQHVYKAVAAVAGRRLSFPRINHLDIGAGRGELIALLNRSGVVKSHACDFHTERFQQAGVPMAQVNLNTQPLPYAENSFDLVTCSEVVEHLEDFRGVLREMLRVLKPGGVTVITTPNVLNMTSRVRYLFTGFANLFGPLPVRNDKLYSTGGHINPLPLFYLAHALLDAGFEQLELDIDRPQRTSSLYAIPFYPLLRLGWLRFLSREGKRFKTLTQENMPFVEWHRSWSVLTGRTIVLSARKPGPTAPIKPQTVSHATVCE